MKYAQILWGKAHWIFESDTVPDFPPDAEGKPITLIDITDKPEVKEGYGYDSKNKRFVPIPDEVPVREGYDCTMKWDEKSCKFIIDYIELPPPPMLEGPFSELSQMMSDLKVDMILAGVI